MGGGFVEPAGVGLDAIVGVDAARLVGPEVGLPVAVGHPAQQHGAFQDKLALVLGKMEVAQLHHGIVRRGDGHAQILIGEVDPNSGR